MTAPDASISLTVEIDPSELDDEGELPEGLIFDESTCAAGDQCCSANVNGEGRPIGGYLAEDPDTGGDRGVWVTTFKVIETGELVCEDCAGAIEERELDATTWTWVTP